METVAEYCDRRLNAEIRDHLLGPVLGGLFVTDGDGLSVADLFFSLTKILGGMLGYRGGIDFFARALAAELDVRTSARASLVERLDDGVRVTWRQEAGEHEEQVAGVVLSVPAPHEGSGAGAAAGGRRTADALSAPGGGPAGA
ncbi:MAG: hypothetical protein JWO02_137 [Solirubrobacterales bacterium]|nr:hypothetical protein [Solirubrobacterales bacterium]